MSSGATRQIMIFLRKAIMHCVWANSCWIDFIASAEDADEYIAKRISHVLLGEQAWFQRLAGEEPDRDIWRTMEVEQMKEMHRKHARTYERLLGDNLDRTIDYVRFSGEEYRSSVSEILLHLVTHGAHHRGQIAAHLGAMGRRPPNTDFVQFCIANRL
jgi:uncharacterized damage-inducible protein DinB